MREGEREIVHWSIEMVAKSKVSEKRR
jgi:hypothetical protein